MRAPDVLLVRNWHHSRGIMVLVLSLVALLPSAADAGDLSASGRGSLYPRKIASDATYTGVSGGKVNILGGHSIGHSNTLRTGRFIWRFLLLNMADRSRHMTFAKSTHTHTHTHTHTCPIPSGFRDRAISLYSSKTVDKKEILRTV
jgi:hypothetical protein